MYLLSFLGIFFNDSVHSLSELHMVTFNIQQMYLAHVQPLILTDEEFFILSVLPGTGGVFGEVLSVIFHFSILLGSQLNPRCHHHLFGTSTALGARCHCQSGAKSKIVTVCGLGRHACSFFLGHRILVHVM